MNMIMTTVMNMNHKIEAERTASTILQAFLL